jgi:hypothetical protein
MFRDARATAVVVCRRAAQATDIRFQMIAAGQGQ